MQIPAESLSATSVRDEVVTATEAVRLIRDGESVVVEGFVGLGFAEELTLASEERFLQTGNPSGLTLVFTVAQGNRQGRGLDRLCHEGLLKRALVTTTSRRRPRVCELLARGRECAVLVAIAGEGALSAGDRRLLTFLTSSRAGRPARRGMAEDR